MQIRKILVLRCRMLMVYIKISKGSVWLDECLLDRQTDPVMLCVVASRASDAPCRIRAHTVQGN